jgi:hypothetical protein
VATALIDGGWLAAGEPDGPPDATPGPQPPDRNVTTTSATAEIRRMG